MRGDLAQTSFGDFLTHAVRRRGWTMADFAAELGVSPSTLSRLRTGRRRPRSVDLDRWAELLGLDAEEHRQLAELALIAQAPPALRERLADAEQRLSHERERHDATAQAYGAYRATQNYHDGFWIAYNYSFLDDGRVLRSLCHVSGTSARWTNMEAGRVQYSYTGSFDVLGDKVFIRLAEDRGGAEYVQVTMDSLFDFSEPTFLYGLVTGLSGKTMRHPLCYPAAARMLMLFVGRDEELRREPEALQELERSLGQFRPADLRPMLPARTIDDNRLRDCLRLGPRDDLDAVLLRMLSNELRAGDGVLCARLG